MGLGERKREAKVLMEQKAALGRLKELPFAPGDCESPPYAH